MDAKENSENVTLHFQEARENQDAQQSRGIASPEAEADAEVQLEKGNKPVKDVKMPLEKELGESTAESISHPTIKATSSSGDSEVRQRRVRKQVQRYSEVLSKSFSEEQEAREKALDAQLAKGSGTALGEIPLIESSIKKCKPADLKLLHYACYGRAGSASEVRSNLRKFNGLPFDARSAEYNRREAALSKKAVKEVQEALRQLHLEVSGTRSQIVTRLLEFLLKPEASAVKYKGKLPPSKRKSASGSRKSRADSDESKTKSTSRSSRKSKKLSQESGEDDGSEIEGLSDAGRDEEEGEEEEDDKEESASEKSVNVSGDERDEDDDYSPPSKRRSKRGASPSRKRKASVKEGPKAQTTSNIKRRRAKMMASESEEEIKKHDDEAEEKSVSEKKSKEGSTERAVDENVGIDDDGDDKDDERPLAKMAPSRPKSEESSREASEAETTKTASAAVISFPSDEELKQRTVEILKKSNLNEVSMKLVRQSVAELYLGIDLSSKKEYLNGVIKEYLASSL